LRFGTLYGTRCGSENSIYRILKEALETKELHLKATGDEVREYVHVKDAALICARFVNRNDKDINIITGHQRLKLTELVNIVKELLGVSIVKYFPKKSVSHYEQVSQRFQPQQEKRIFPIEPRDFGGSLIEILEEINEK